MYSQKNKAEHLQFVIQMKHEAFEGILLLFLMYFLLKQDVGQDINNIRG